MNESDALALILAVEAQDGREGGWSIHAVEDLGWMATTTVGRSSMAYAVTPTGRIGAFMMTTTRAEEALKKLAALSEPRSASIDDRDAAEEFLESAVAELGELGHTGWKLVEVGTLGWLGTPMGVASTLRFAVSRTGQVALCPDDDPTGAATLQELTDRAAKIPVAFLG